MKKSIAARRSASVKALMEIKDVTAEDAARIREIWFNVASRRGARGQIEAILRTYGIEYLGVHKRSHEHVYYANGGDTYDTTVLFIGPRLAVGCWGDLVERNMILGES